MERFLLSVSLNKSIDFFKGLNNYGLMYTMSARHTGKVLFKTTSSGLLAKVKDNGWKRNILEQSYYYWQRKLRNETYDQMNKSCLPFVKDTNKAVSFVEIYQHLFIRKFLPIVTRTYLNLPLLLKHLQCLAQYRTTYQSSSSQ